MRGYRDAMSPIAVQCVADVHAVLGEGPVWVAREHALYWLDIKGLKIFRLSDDGQTDANGPRRCESARSPRARSGGFIAGTEEGIADHRPRYRTGSRSSPTPKQDLPDNRFNDGKVDRHGRFWAGTMDDTERDATGTLYRVDPDLGAAPQSTAATGSPTDRPSAPPATSCTTTTRARQVTYAFDLDAVGQGRATGASSCSSALATAIPTE